MINLLIAVFTIRFNKIHEKTDLIWKLQRYELVHEYTNLYPLPPPLSPIAWGIIIYVKSQANEPTQEQTKLDNDASMLEKNFAKELINKMFKKANSK